MGRRGALAGERGSVTIITVVLVALVLTLGLFLFDMMVFLRARGEAQTAADAAAKAAGLELSPLFGVGNDPRTAAALYAGMNGAELIGCSLGRQAGRYTVTVTVSRRASTVFVPMGRGGFSVTATARCYLDPGGGPAGVEGAP
jgi:uncharacterized membrane protein